jgi:hypothetical protein
MKKSYEGKKSSHNAVITSTLYVCTTLENTGVIKM